jgi:hypothetical protein
MAIAQFHEVEIARMHTPTPDEKVVHLCRRRDRNGDYWMIRICFDPPLILAMRNAGGKWNPYLGLGCFR